MNNHKKYSGMVFTTPCTKFGWIENQGFAKLPATKYRVSNAILRQSPPKVLRLLAKKTFVNISLKTVSNFGKEILNSFFCKAGLIQTLHRDRANLNLMSKLEANWGRAHQVGHLIQLIKIYSLGMNTSPYLNQIWQLIIFNDNASSSFKHAWPHRSKWLSADCFGNV